MIEALFQSSQIGEGLWACIGAFFGVFCFAHLLGCSLRITWISAAISFIGWGIYLFFLPILGVFGATLSAAVFISWCAQLFSRIIKCPVTMFLIPSLATLVPGKQVFQAVSSLISGDAVMTSRMSSQTFLMAWAIALGVILVEAFYAMRAGMRIKWQSRLLRKQKKLVNK